MINQSILKICQKIKKSGGDCFFVGGYVRDEILGISTNDIDIEVFNLSYENLKEILSKYPYKEHKKFGVFILKDATFALPRREKKNGKNHYAFEVEININLTIKEAAKRRDFTINAIYKNVLTGQIIDPFNGVNDLKNKTLKCITKNFVEDDVRIIRAIRFSSMYDLIVEPSTMELLKQMNFSNISPERLKQECEKMQSAKYKEAGNKIIRELQINEKIRI